MKHHGHELVYIRSMLLTTDDMLLMYGPTEKDACHRPTMVVQWKTWECGGICVVAVREYVCKYIYYTRGLKGTYICRTLDGTHPLQGIWSSDDKDDACDDVRWWCPMPQPSHCTAAQKSTHGPRRDEKTNTRTLQHHRTRQPSWFGPRSNITAGA